MYIEPDVVGTDLPADPLAPTLASDPHGARGGRVTGADASGRRQLEALGELIRKQRQQAELTLRDLAERANVSNPYLSQIERGLHEPSVRVLKAIAGALNLSAEPLLVQAGVLDGTEQRVAAATERRGRRAGRPAPQQRPARRADERLPELRRRRRAAKPTSASARPKTARAAPRGERRRSSREVPRRDSDWESGVGAYAAFTAGLVAFLAW